MKGRAGSFARPLGWLLALALTGAATLARAQEPEPAPPAAAVVAEPADAPKVTSKLTPDTLEVGGLAKLVITVDAPSTTEVSLPEQSFGQLELTGRHARTLVQGNRTITTYELELLALDAGKQELPALSLRFVSQSGELGSAQTEAHALTVRSLIANEPNAEPKPATRPLSVMHDDYTVAWVGLGLLAVALIALATLLIARWLKRRPKPAEPLPPPRPAWELAIERLHALLGQKEQLFAEQRGEEFVDGVSDALREYLGRRYGFDGLERTTGELMSTLEKLRPHKLSLPGVSQLLDQCDLVKFARAKPDADECQDLWNGAIGLIRATTPLTQPQGPLTASPSRPPPPLLDEDDVRTSQLPPLRSSHFPDVPALQSHAPLPPADSAVPAAPPRDPSVRGWSNAPPPDAERSEPVPESASLEDRITPVTSVPVLPTPVVPAPVAAPALPFPADDDEDAFPDAPTVVTRVPSLPPPPPRSSAPPAPPSGAALPPKKRTSSLPAPAARASVPPAARSSRPPPKRSSAPAEPGSARPAAPKRPTVPPPPPRKPDNDQEKP